ncbi:hydantoinase B/oxoprolinase family protein [Beggiatoa alba]|nr:hydantoinase B/oxoprolinase family protein [Beggiatoa alba]
MDVIALSLFSNRLAAVCDEMGAILQRAAFSPNIRDRLDFSCAVFDTKGDLCAQAAHIPVHLGSMAYAMQGIVSRFDWQAGDMVVCNDPYLGGTHLPDVTFIAPVIIKGELHAFVANRAHHADIGADSPGSMPISSSLEEEGLIIPPSYIMRQGQRQDEMMRMLLDASRQPQTMQGDVAAQMSANRTGCQRLEEMIDALILNGDEKAFSTAMDELNDYGERLAQPIYEKIPDGVYCFTDYMDDDGQGQQAIPIKACITIQGNSVHVDFNGTAKQVAGNINCPLSVAAAAVYYVFRCLLPDHTPACAGTFRGISLSAPQGCLVNANYPAAVAAGNVETSTRIVDVIIGALLQAIPEQLAAASHGSMNNVAMGFVGDSQQAAWDYYETIGGGMGASSKAAGLSGVQTHMTNTLNTPVEVLETIYPLRIKQYALRRGSGGQGKQPGGDGIIREYEFTHAASVSLLTERRHFAPWGVAGGEKGQPGKNSLNKKVLAAKTCVQVSKGDCLIIETPGGGAWGN